MVKEIKDKKEINNKYIVNEDKEGEDIIMEENLNNLDMVKITPFYK